MTLIHPDDYDLDAVRAEWCGKLLSEARGRYPVEYDPIRRHCHMVGDLNPLFLDPDTAGDGPYGEVIVPPSMLPIYFASEGPWPPRPIAEDSDRPIFTLGVPTPGDRGINMEVEYEFLEPIRVGDRLRLQLRIADVYKKAIRLDPHAIWIVSETSIYNQHDAVVAKWRNTVLVHRAPEQIRSDDARETGQQGQTP
ncbi:MAG: MaoC family dehydratase N-terminal domain-containing protein [Halioglobus sp.]|nr:MaoC family dehydratase N-terminal domain-containing protein [Halioglobus sp.]